MAIGANNFALALALGALGQAPRRARIAIVFGLFEFSIPLVGLLIGRELAEGTSDGARWIGALLLCLLGAWTLATGVGSDRAEALSRRVGTWSGLVGLAAGLSLDNLTVGFALGLGGAAPLLVATVIASFSVAFTLIGLQVGAAGRGHWERRTETLAGLALVAVGILVAAGWIG